MTSAIANVSSTDIIVSVAGRRRASSIRCMTTPTTKNSGTVISKETSGSIPVSLWKYHARYAARIRKAEWAIITTRITPK